VIFIFVFVLSAIILSELYFYVLCQLHRPMCTGLIFYRRQCWHRYS